MSGDDFGYDPYGDTDPNNVPDGGAGQDTSAGDGLPGVPLDGHPGLRAGVFGTGKGLLGMARVPDLLARRGDDQPFGGVGDPRLMLASDPRSSSPTLASDGRQTYPMPKAYVPDGHGGVRLRPDFAAAHPGASDFGGMWREINGPGALKGLMDILGGVANSKIDDWVEDLLGIPSWLDLPKLGAETWKAQDEANKDPGHRPQGADRVTNGLP